MVAWTRTELTVYGIKDSPKKEPEILINMFHIIMSYYSLLLIKRKWMGNIVLAFSICSLFALCHRFSKVAEGIGLGAISPV